jgi:O-antigen/teichoic acid export membrane protein
VDPTPSPVAEGAPAEPGRAALLRRLQMGAGQSFVIRVAGLGAAFLMQLLAARHLGAVEFGYFSVVLALCNLLSMVALLGLDRAVLALVPRFLAQDDPAGLAAFLRFTERVGCLAVDALVLAFLGYVLWRGLDDSFSVAVALGGAVIPAYALINLAQALALARKKVGMALGPSMVLRPALVIAVLGIVMLAGVPLDAASLLLVNALATVAAYLFIRPAAWPAEERGIRPGPASPSAWLGVALPLLAMTALNGVQAQADVLMLGALRDTTQAGFYSVAARLATLVSFSLTAINTVMAPMISELHAKERTPELQAVVHRASVLALAAAVPAAGGLIVLGPWVLGIYGEAFSAAYPALVILCAGQLVNAAAGPVGYLLTMTGQQRLALLAFGVSTGANLALNALLIPPLGLVGAGIATAVSLILVNGLMFVFVERRLGIRSSAFHRRAGREGAS